MLKCDDQIHSFKTLNCHLIGCSFQLLDFRQVLARLLGLDINTLSVPDYEIISRLERLVQAHHAHSITTHSLEASLQDMESGFRAGYDDAVAILRTPSPVKVS